MVASDWYVEYSLSNLFACTLCNIYKTWISLCHQNCQLIVSLHQMMMAVFAYIYHQSFVVTSQGFSVELILDQVWVLLVDSMRWSMNVSWIIKLSCFSNQIISHLADQEQHDLHFQLGKILRARGRQEELLLLLQWIVMMSSGSISYQSM